MSRFFLTILILPVSEAWSALQYASQGLSLKESQNTLEDQSYGAVAAGIPDPTCLKGLPDGPQRTCCSPKCWTCGSHAMCNKPKKFFEITGSNNTDCCDNIILAGSRKCDKDAPPCILSAAYRAKFKKDLMLPINEERHTQNKAIIKQRQFRFILYYKVKKSYDFGSDIARDVRTLSNIQVKKAKENVKKFQKKLARNKELLAARKLKLMQMSANSTVLTQARRPKPVGPVREAVWQVQVELNEDEARFYAQIRRNAIWIAGNCTEGLARVDHMKVVVQTNLDKINSYDGEVKKLQKDAKEVHRLAKILWQQWKNNAKQFNCTPTPVVEHAANVIAVPNTRTRRVPVTCQVGFDSKQSKNSLRCLKQGEFGKALIGQLSGVATCVGRNCGKPPTIKKATTVVQDIIHPNAAAYTCFEGHSMDGAASGAKTFNVKCNKLGKFNFKEHKHKCDPIRCGKALTISNSFPIAGSFHFAQRLNYKCKQGYTIDGMAAGLKGFEIACLATGEFGAPQKCRAVRCGPNPTYDNTKLETKAADQFYSMESNYKCNTGYSLNQKYGGLISYTLSCHHNGEFVVKGNAGAAIPVCRAVSAGMAPKVKFGNYQNKEMFYGETAIVTAETGYSILSEVGKGLQFTLSVTPKGEYAGLKEYKPVKCGKAPEVSNSKHSFKKPVAVFGDFLSYDCTKGYSTDASKAVAKQKFTIQCQADGILSTIPGKGECVNIDDCAEHTCGPFGHCKDLLLNYTCVCKDGYEETYDEKMKERVCGNIDDCGPEACGAGECEDGLNTYKCICPTGYEVFTTGEGETCRKVTCGTPPRVQHSATKPVTTQTEKIYYKGVAHYACAQGYTHDSTAAGETMWQITCGADRDFSAGKTCKPIDCGDAPSVAHATAGGAEATFNQSIKYECKEGFSIDATPTGDAHFSVTCQDTGKYSLALTCLPILCGEPDQVANAARPSGKAKYNDVIKYNCFEGFTIDGHRDSKSTFEAKCLASGKFTSLETCNPKICGEPPKKIHALHATSPDVGKLHYPQVAEITCRDGYTVGGDPKGKPSFVVKCEKNGKFEGYDPKECEAVKCGMAPPLANATFARIVNVGSGATLTTKHLSFGLRATYKCAEGFTAGGEFDAVKEVKAECLSSGAFSVPTKDLLCRNVDDCSKHTCGPKGTCIDLVGPAPAYTCKCLPGYEIQTLASGEKFCGNIDDCGKDKCGPGVCQDLVGGFTCICPTGHFLAEKDKENTCLPVQCATGPPEVKNAEREDSHTGAVVFPTTLRYKCKTGYSTDASAADAKAKFQASCKAHGKLFGMMRCLPVTCGTPHIFPFTHLKFPASKTSILEYGQSAKYKCFEGYSIKGTADGALEYSTKCLPTGVLGDPEVCEPIKCGRAPRMEKCRSSVAGDVTYGMDVQYECDKGHTLTGLAGGKHHFHRKCQKDAEFEDAEGECKPVSAGAVPQVRNAAILQYAGKHVAAGESLTAYFPQGLEYKCKPGFTLTGGADGQTKFVTQVNSVGKFAPPLPAKCKRIVFKVQGEVKNAQTGGGLAGVRVQIVGLRRGILSQNGFFTLNDIRTGGLRLKYTKNGFITSFKSVTVSGDITSGGLADISMSPKMRPPEWRAVVKWGEYPYDLDSYASWGTQSVCWYNAFAQSGYQGKLEVDDTDGHGPETVHFSNVGTCEGGAYACDIKYMINDYDDTGDMFSDSEAQVTLYHGDSQAGTWKIKDCQGAVSEDGYWWHVFTIDGAKNELKWNCGQAAMLLDVGPNATISATQIEQDFDNYVGPFPGRYLKRSRHTAGVVKPPPATKRLRAHASK